MTKKMWKSNMWNSTTLIWIILSFICMPESGIAQDKIIHLWEDTPIYTKKAIEKDEIGEGGRITKVAQPELFVYFPEDATANHMAVMICPGGGYGILAIEHEGHAIAKWYQDKGYLAAVLKYRLPEEELLDEPWKVPLTDAIQGIKIIRTHAEEWNIHPDKVGVLGFSAGGHLASSLSVHGDIGDEESISSKPDFSILIYPVISLDTTITHQGSRKNLLGEKLGTEWEKYYSTETQVNTSTPPAFMVHSWDDKGVPAENSIRYAKALNQLGIPVELHLFEKGGHGFGMGNISTHGNAAEWNKLSDAWIKGIF
jgi:acetyl esterase/lipase